MSYGTRFASRYAVDEAASGAAALDRRRAGFRPALVLLDLRMPGLDGASLLHEMQRSTALAGLPTIVITAANVSAGDIGSTAAHGRWIEGDF